MLLNLLVNTICVEFKFYLNYIIFKNHTHTHTHTHTLQNIYIVTRYTNVKTMNITFLRCGIPVVC